MHTHDSSGRLMSVVERFAARAVLAPDAPALEDGPRTVTYAELAGRVADTASDLVARGVVPSDVVAVDYPRSVDFVVAVLAVQAVGAVSLPLHPGDPSARRAVIMQEARATHRLAADFRRGFVNVAVAPPGTAGAALDPVARRPDDLAFVFATSGSTGTPKLVALSHGACLSGVDWARDALGADEADRYLFRTATSFVTVLRQVVWPLATGGTCVVMPAGSEADLALVVRLLRDHDVSISTFIPSALRAALPLVEPGSLPRLRHVLCGAEPLTEELRQQAADRLPGTVLHNLYAPTESPMVTHHRCTPQDTGTSPLGAAVAGATVRVVTDDGELATPGGTGEILVGGTSLYAGYLQDGTLVDGTTTDRWGDGGRLHRTGDLARVEQDGSLVYVGRSGDFVKVRGFRVAPGEIESALLRHPSVRAAVVVPVPSAGGSTLVGFVVPQDSPAAGELEAHLRGLVPDYMVPAQILELDGIPLLPNGKTDRLRLVEHALRRRTSTRTEPRDPWEAVVMSTWQKVLRTTEFGVDDRFLDLGGDSLAAVEMAFLLDDAFETELPSHIFRSAATVAELAAACRSYVPEAPTVPPTTPGPASTT